MTILFMETTSTSAADDIVAAVQAKSLWGVDMGTTSSSSSYSDRALVECTETRAGKLMEACPEEVEISTYDSAPPSFSSSDGHCQIWYLRGML
jgi:hypothetical protein